MTGIYRKYLDLYAANGRYKVDPADHEDLSHIFSRGSFTEGYLHGNPKKHLMSGDLSKHQGIYIGKVVKGSAGISIPLSRINELRRSVLEELEALHRKSRNPVEISWSLPTKQPVPQNAATTGSFP